MRPLGLRSPDGAQKPSPASQPAFCKCDVETAKGGNVRVKRSHDLIKVGNIALHGLNLGAFRTKTGGFAFRAFAVQIGNGHLGASFGHGFGIGETNAGPAPPVTSALRPLMLN